ncbi:MAG: hypothetical protein ACPLPT_06360 [Moorellales bacterium]
MLVLRWPAVVLAFAVTLVGLFTGYHLYEEYGVRRPLEQRVAASGLAEEVAWQKGQKEVVVRLRQVGDLKAAYSELEGAIGTRIVLQIADRPNAKLLACYRRVEPALYEAAARDNFTALAERVEREATRAGLNDWAVQVDGRRIYLALYHGDAYLYRVVPHR